MPKIVDVDQYRKELLHKSFDLFAQKGYAALTTRELAQELGVSTGTLYHYFSSKAALFEQLIEEMCQQDVLMATVEIKKAKTLTDKLETLGYFLDKREDICLKQLFLWIDYCQNQEREELLKQKFFEKVDQQYLQAINDLFGIKDQTIALFVLSQINGLLLERLWGNSQVSLPEQMRLLGEILTVYLEKGLGARG